MAKILVISEDLWYPPNYGDAVRQYPLLRNLSRIHNYVWCCRYRSVPTELEKHEGGKFARSESFFIPRPHIAVKVTKAFPFLLSGRPITQAAYRFRKLLRRIRHLTSTEYFDIVQIEHSKMAEYAKAIAPSCKAIRLLTVQNLEHVYWKRLAVIEKSLWRRLYFNFESERWRRVEENALRRFDAFITVSKDNVNWLKQNGMKRMIHLSRNGIDIEKIPFLFPSDKAVVMMAGAMDYLPNIDAAIFFTKEVLPLVWAKRPDVRFFIVGRNPVGEIKELESHHRIFVTGTVPDLTPYYEQAALTVVPLRAGSGTRLKIVESMAFGRVVISTTIGAEGLLYKDGENIMIADDPGQIADLVTEVLENYDLRNCLAVNARKHVEAQYNCNVIAQHLNDFYHEVIKARLK